MPTHRLFSYLLLYLLRNIVYNSIVTQCFENELLIIVLEQTSCRKTGESAESEAAQSLVKQLQAYITDHFYTCTQDILAGLGLMYVEDERFRSNIDRYGEGTAAFACDAIRYYCGRG